MSVVLETLYLFHNTVTQPMSDGKTFGCAQITSRDNPYNLYSRNNIFWASLSQGTTILGGAEHTSNDFDYDLYNGNIEGPVGFEPNGLGGATPTFGATNAPYDATVLQTGDYFLEPGSPGQSEGVFVPNFSGADAGVAPDVGAYQLGQSPLRFGVRSGSQPD